MLDAFMYLIAEQEMPTISGERGNPSEQSMLKLMTEAAAHRRAPKASGTFSRIMRSGSIALMTLLAGCASNGVNGQIFDYAAPAAQVAETQASAETTAKTNRKTEEPKNKSASALLGDFQTGTNYTIQPDVLSDGRYNTYTFVTEYGTYAVTGDDLARKHIQEMNALNALKKYSKTAEFAKGVGGAVTGPVKAVFNTVTNPVVATKATYTNVKSKVKSVKRGASKAGEFITTLGHPEKTRPDREDDGLLEGVVGRPEAKRRIAKALKVDPYTHFVPLADELDKVASYSTAGEFGISKAVGFVAGPAGTVISGLKTLDSLTDQTLDMSPGETAVINRERLKNLDIPDATIKKILLTDKLTPTEKIQAVGYLNNLSGAPGLSSFASFLATSDTRHGAFSALLTLSYLSKRPFEDMPIDNAEIVDDILILTAGDSKKIVIFPSDDFSWTRRNADRFSKLGKKLKSNAKGKTKLELRISGNASSLAKRQLQRQGWIVKINSFDI